MKISAFSQWFSHLGIFKRILMVVVICFLVGLVFAAAINIYMAKTDSYQQAEKSLNANMRVASFLLSMDGEKAASFSTNGTHLFLGNRVLNGDNTEMDQMERLVGGYSSLLLGDTRIASNIRREDGTRIIGTKMVPEVADIVLRQGLAYTKNTTLSLGGIPFITHYEPLRNKNGEVIGALEVGIKKSLFRQRNIETVRKDIRLGAVVLFMSCIGIVFALRRETNKIKTLQSTIHQVSNGDVSSPIPYLNSPDEIGDLARALKQFRDNKIAADQVTAAETAKEIALKTAKMKSEFLASMSHELRTPMNAILGFTKFLIESPLNSTQKEYVETMQEAGNSLISLINEILDLSKIEAGKIVLHEEDVDFYKNIESIVTLLSAQTYKKGIELAIFIAPDVPQIVKIDVGRLKQMLINIIGNAIKFTENGGVTLQISKPEETAEKIRLEFKVVDTGIGIAKEDIGKLFQEFAQANDAIEQKFGGTGLGLMITKRLIALKEGEIKVESELGIGTTFSFTLLLDKSSAEQPASLIEKLQGKDYKAVVLSDNAVLSGNIRHQLAVWNITATVATRATFEQEVAGGADVLFLDYALGDAGELAKTVKATPATAAVKIALLQHSSEAGALENDPAIDVHLTKPVRQKTLAGVFKG